MGSKGQRISACFFILTRKYFFNASLKSVCILLSTYSDNRNLNLFLLNKYLLGDLVFYIFEIVKGVFLICIYVRNNRVFSTGVSPPTSLKFSHLPTGINSPSGRLPTDKFFVPK